MASGPLGGSRQQPDPLAPLLRWAAEDRVRSARVQRVRQASLLRQAGERTRWRAVLVDVAERGAPVAVAARCGVLRGTLGAVGEDFVAVRGERRTVLVRLDAVSQLWSDDDLPWGFRGVTGGWTLAETLVELAHDQPIVRVQSAAGPVRTGQLLRAGLDVITIRAEPDADGSISFNLVGIDAVTLAH